MCEAVCVAVTVLLTFGHNISRFTREHAAMWCCSLPVALFSGEVPLVETLVQAS